MGGDFYAYNFACVMGSKGGAAEFEGIEEKKVDKNVASVASECVEMARSYKAHCFYVECCCASVS